MKAFVLVLVFGLLGISCSQKSEEAVFEDYEFVVMDSLVTEILEPIQVLDFHKERKLYLAVKRNEMKGHYYVLDDSGEIVAENFLSEGPDAIGFVLLRAGFVGDEIFLLTQNKAFVFDLNLHQLRSFPFEQKPRFMLVHLVQDVLSKYKGTGDKVWAVGNLNDAFLNPYSENYFDTLSMVSLINSQDGTVRKGGNLDSSGMYRSGNFFPFMDKPYFFSDEKSTLISTILAGDSVLYQLDPNQNFKTANRILLPRIGPDKLASVPMAEANAQSIKQYRSQNFSLGGRFDQMLGYGDEILVGYQTGAEPSLYREDPSKEERDAEIASRKRYYYLISEGKRLSTPIEWTFPGRLWLNVGPNRFLQEGDQAEIHEWEKEYQCFYIFSLVEKEKE